MKTRAHSILLDSEALNGLARGTRAMQTWAAFAQRSDSILYVSSVTLAETTDGSREHDVRIRRALKALRVLDVSESIGFDAGRLRAGAAGRRKSRSLTVDAIVAATAQELRTPVVVVTADVGDFRLLLGDSQGIRVEALSET